MNPSGPVSGIHPATRGIHHLALNTEDMQATTDFYVRVVGMPLVHAMKVPAGLGTGPGNRGNPPYECLRHYFFDMGNDSLLAFFEMPRGAEPQARRDAIAGIQHCAFCVTPDGLQALMQRLHANNVEFQGPIDILPGLQSIYFFDPNGFRLELTVPTDPPGYIAAKASSARAECDAWSAEKARRRTG